MVRVSFPFTTSTLRFLCLLKTGKDHASSFTQEMQQCSTMLHTTSSLPSTHYSPHVRLRARCSWTVPKHHPSSRTGSSQHPPRYRRRPGLQDHQATHLPGVQSPPVDTYDSSLRIAADLHRTASTESRIWPCAAKQ